MEKFPTPKQHRQTILFLLHSSHFDVLDILVVTCIYVEPRLILYTFSITARGPFNVHVMRGFDGLAQLTSILLARETI